MFINEFDCILPEQLNKLNYFLKFLIMNLYNLTKTIDAYSEAQNT